MLTCHLQLICHSNENKKGVEVLKRVKCYKNNYLYRFFYHVQSYIHKDPDLHIYF